MFRVVKEQVTNSLLFRYHIWISISVKYRVNRYYRNIAQP